MFKTVLVTCFGESNTRGSASELAYFNPCFVLVEQVFDATNTTRERRKTIIQFAEQNGFKVSFWVTVLWK